MTKHLRHKPLEPQEYPSEEVSMECWGWTALDSLHWHLDSEIRIRPAEGPAWCAAHDETTADVETCNAK